MKFCKIFISNIIVLLILSSIINAGTTGKIAGKVTDAETGEPLVGVNVIIISYWIDNVEVDMSMKQGAATNIDGQYFIINIPPGIYSVKFSMIGYKDKIVKTVVSVDKTTFLDVSLSQEAIQGEEVVVVGSKTSVQKDLTSSQSTVSSERIMSMPAEKLDDIVNTQAGVIGKHFRGGRAGEVSRMIDGVMINNDFKEDRQEAVNVETESAQDILIISGTFNAEYGKAMSGIVNVVTKDGGDKYQGDIAGFLGNYVSSHSSTFLGLDNKDFTRINDFKFSFGGPFVSKKIKFFVNGRFYKNSGYLWGIRRFRVTDYSDFESDDTSLWVSEHTGDNKKVSLSKNINKNLFAKLSFKPFYNLKLFLSYTLNRKEYMDFDDSFSDIQTLSNKPYHHDGGFLYKYDPDGAPTFYKNSDLLMFGLNHVISPSLFYDLKLTYLESHDKGYVYENPLDSRYVHPKYSYSRPGFYTGGNYKLWDHNIFKKNILKFDLNWQANQVHGFKTGFEYTKDEVNKTHYDIVNKTEDPDNFVPSIRSDSTFYTEIYTKRPVEFSAYVQDKMEFNELIINLGVRYDYFNPKTKYPTDYRNPDNSISSVKKISQYKNAPSQAQLSPRFGLSYQLADAAFLHFSYGHFFQMPAFYSLYDEHNFHVSYENYETMMGNPRLKAEKTVAYEVGLQQEIMPSMVLDVSLFYRDIYNLLTVVPMQTYDARVYGLYTNLSYAMAKGLTVNLDYSHNNFFVNLNYSLQYAEGEASNPQQFFITSATQDPIIKLTRLDHDQRHTLNAILGYSNDKLNATFSLKYESNFPYTYKPVSDDYKSKARIPVNNSNMPSKFNADFKLYYTLTKGSKIRPKLYLEVYNLFDNLNEIKVWSTTGRAGSTLDVYTQRLNYKSDFTTINDFFFRPYYFSAPRMIKFGFSLSFYAL